MGVYNIFFKIFEYVCFKIIFNFMVCLSVNILYLFLLIKFLVKGFLVGNINLKFLDVR